MNIEEQIQKGLFKKDVEKTYIDKMLAREEIEKIRVIIKKDDLKREDVIELLYLLTGAESKLYNFDQWDRYLVLKYYVWIREFVQMTEILYDYEDSLKKNKIQLDRESAGLLNDCKMKMQHNVKFMVDLYLNMCRTSQSVKNTAFIELLKNRFEMLYDNTIRNTQDTKKSIWGNNKNV